MPTRSSTTETDNKEQRHERHQQRLPGFDRGRPHPADHPHDPRLRRHPGAVDARSHRSRVVRPLGRAERDADQHRRLGCHHGGPLRYVAERDGEEYGFHGCFHDVGEDRIVQTFTYDGQPDGVALETLWFEDLGGGRTRLRAESLVDSFEGRDAWLASGMETGVEDGYAKLDSLIAEL